MWDGHKRFDPKGLRLVSAGQTTFTVEIPEDPVLSATIGIGEGLGLRAS